MNNLRQLTLASLNYESARQKLPSAMGVGKLDSTTLPENARRLSGLVAMLPFLEQNRLYEKIAHASEFDGVEYPAFGPPLSDSSYMPWQYQVPAFICPVATQPDSDFGVTNYAFNIGDVARNIHEPTQLRGAFACGRSTNIGDFTDGTSNTIAFAEIGGSAGREVNGQFATELKASILGNPAELLTLTDRKKPNEYAAAVSVSKLGRGGHWADGSAGPSLVNMILPPNSPSGAVAGQSKTGAGIYSAGGSHGCVVLVGYADGSTHSIPLDIDAGDSTAATPTDEQFAEPGFASPYGVWGALGTANGEEVISNLDF